MSASTTRIERDLLGEWQCQPSKVLRRLALTKTQDPGTIQRYVDEY